MGGTRVTGLRWSYGSAALSSSFRQTSLEGYCTTYPTPTTATLSTQHYPAARPYHYSMLIPLCHAMPTIISRATSRRDRWWIWMRWWWIAVRTSKPSLDDRIRRCLRHEPRSVWFWCSYQNGSPSASLAVLS